MTTKNDTPSQIYETDISKAIHRMVKKLCSNLLCWLCNGCFNFLMVMPLIIWLTPANVDPERFPLFTESEKAVRIGIDCLYKYSLKCTF